MTVTVSRAQLSWALSAALPHCGNAHGVGLLHTEGNLYVASTDNYTSGIAILEPEYGDDLNLELPVAEAKELLRAVKPTRKAEQEEAVRLLHCEAELHVAIGEQVGEVYDAPPSGADLARYLIRHVQRIEDLPMDNHHQVYNPEFLSRFAKAAKPGELVRIQPHATTTAIESKYGIALVSIGETFIGAVAGISYAYAEKLPSIHDALRKLPARERKVA